MGEIAQLLPGQHVVPDGWWKSVAVPWADKQTHRKNLAQATAQLAGLEAAWREMGLDTKELMKARRYLELRWGQLLGPGKPGPQESSLVSEDLHYNDRYHFRRLAAGREKVMERLEAGKKEEELTRAALLRAITGAHVGHATGDDEWYTPEAYIEAARRTLGEIDLDPASSEEANTVVQAKRFYSVDGYEKQWAGRIWMNPPYSSGLIQKFCGKLGDEYLAGNVTAAIALINNATETRWFQKLGACASGLCLPLGRVKFWHPRKESVPLQGQAILYLGDQFPLFDEEFHHFGLIWRR